MNVVDSSDWLSYFANDDNAAEFSEPIENLDDLLVLSITIAEAFKNVLRQPGEDAAFIVTAHEAGKSDSLGCDARKDAAKFGVHHKLPLTNSIIFATAQKYAAIHWTQDKDYDGLENVRFIATKRA